MKLNRYLKALLLIIISSFVLLATLLLYYSSQVLTKNQPILSKTLVIEGWLPTYDLERIADNYNLKSYKTIYVTGTAHYHPENMANNPKYRLKELPVNLYSNGCIGLSKSGLERIRQVGTISQIKVYAYGSYAMRKFTNFFLAVNDSILGNVFVSEQPKIYAFNFRMTVSNVKGIYIYYNNDVRIKKEDRNLIVDSVSINGIVLNKTKDFFLIPDRYVDDNLYTNYPFQSNAMAAIYYLKALGVKNHIVLADTFFNNRNKTLAAARRFYTLIKNPSDSIDSFNVVSLNGHSRRSYLAYKAATFGYKKIGIISLDDSDIRRKPRFRIWLYHTLDEYLSVFVTYLITIF